MTLNKRERNIALGTGAIIALGLLYWVAWQPYSDSLDALEQQKTELTRTLDEGKMYKARERILSKPWSEMRRDGLRNDDSTAESQFYAAILYWAQHARTSDPSFKTDPLKPDKEAAANGFEEITFHVTVTGTLSQISELLWSMETATLPLRVTDVQITPKKEGLDSSSSPLTAQVTVATLSWMPAPEPQEPSPAASETAMATSTESGS